MWLPLFSIIACSFDYTKFIWLVQPLNFFYSDSMHSFKSVLLDNCYNFTFYLSTFHKYLIRFKSSNILGHWVLSPFASSETVIFYSSVLDHCYSEIHLFFPSIWMKAMCFLSIYHSNFQHSWFSQGNEAYHFHWHSYNSRLWHFHHYA